MRSVAVALSFSAFDHAQQSIFGLMLMFFAWLKKRREERALIERDAAAMIEKFDCRP
jgi:hypothetical protein